MSTSKERIERFKKAKAIFAHHGNPCDRQCGGMISCVCINHIEGIADALLAARVEGLREARKIADELDPGNGSAIERDMNEDRDNELIAAIDARISALTTDTTDTTDAEEQRGYDKGVADMTAERDALRAQLQTAREALLGIDGETTEHVVVGIDGETIDRVVVGIARQALAAIKKETQP